MPKFAGGISIDQKGYLVITAGPLRNTRVHTVVAEAKLGRKLHPDEHVHHRDLNKLNPAWDNLLILGEKDHGYVSSRQAWFLKNRERAELARWQEWIETGAGRPDEAESGDGDPAEEAETNEAEATADIEDFNDQP